MKPSNVHKTAIGLLSLSFGTCFLGCSTFTSSTSTQKKDSSWNWFKKQEYQIPRSMASYWKEDTLTMPGMPTARGFGGRIYFYDETSKVIPVDGELVVHAYDESLHANPNISSEAADMTFHFRPDEFATHFSPGQFGASYSVWLPIDHLGGFQKKITLIPTFRSKDGKTIIQGQPSKVTLPGKSPSGLQEHAEPASVKIDMAANPTNTSELIALTNNPWAGAKSGLQTTTINVPLTASSPMLTQNSPAHSMNTPINAAVVNDQADMKQQIAALQKQYMESNMRSMQVTNALLGQSIPSTPAPANAGVVPASNVSAPNAGWPAGPQIPSPNVPSNAFNKDYALGPFGPITNATNPTTQSVHSVWNQSQAPASTSAQPAAYHPL